MSLNRVQTGDGRLAGKVAIITGAASGFGLACAKRFLEEGAKVIAADMNEQGLAKSYATMHETHVVTVTANVTIASDWEKAVKTATDKFGGVDILVNNAGTSYKNKPTLDVTEEEFDKVFAVNVKSIYHSVPVIVPAMKARGGGSIINIASIGAMRPRPGLVWYNASKGAVANVSFVTLLSSSTLIPIFNLSISWTERLISSKATKGLAAEFGKDQIRVNAICPLLSGTGLFEQFVGVPFTEENVQKFLFNVPLGRLTDPVDVANMALFLGSDEGKFITGTNLEVDGGRAVGA